MKEKVDIIMPYITAELGIMAENRELFEEKGIKVSVASPEAIEIANDKMRLYDNFAKFMPWQERVTTDDELANAMANHIGAPMCCKLTNSCGGRGFAIIDNKKAADLTLLNSFGIDRYINGYTLQQCLKKQDTHIILSQYIDGTDYSVYILADHGDVKYKCGIIGHVVGYGAIMNGEISKHDKAYEIVDEVTKEIGLDGIACFDFKIDRNGKPYMLEINPRLSATIPFIAEACLNLPYLRCRQLSGKSIDGYDFPVRYGLKMNKYYVSEYYV